MNAWNVDMVEYCDCADVDICQKVIYLNEMAVKITDLLKKIGYAL